MRSIGLDIHRDFSEVAIAESGELRSPGRIEMTPEALEQFAQSLARTDQVARSLRALRGDSRLPRGLLRRRARRLD